MPKNRIITGLDIGTSQMKALAVGRNPESREWEVLGRAQIPSFGVRRGVVVKIEEVSKRIVELLSQLQQEIGQKIEDVYINISGSHIFTTPSRGTVVVSRADQKISEEDKNRALQAAQTFSLPSNNQEILNIFPREFIVDSQGQIKEPVGMQGLRLEVETVALCAFSPFLKNLTAAVLNSGFQIFDITPSALASAEAVLTPQQKELGVCLVDIGAGATDMAVYEEGDLIHTAVFPVGSERITNDLAIGLKTEVEIAEKIKREFGSCVFKGSDKKEKVESSIDTGNGEPLVFSRKMLAGIIGARVSEIFDLVYGEIKKISPQALLPAGVVLTGGGVRLPKIVELAKKELKLPVRIGVPRKMAEENDLDLSWSTACGLVLGGIELEREGVRKPQDISKETIARFKKMFKIFIP